MDFLKQVASSSPVPAGGAVGAYGACLGIGLIYKVILLTIKRDKNAPHIEMNLLAFKKEVERLLKDVEKLVGEDPEAYMKFSRSLRVGDKTEMKLHYSNIIDVSIKVMEKSDTALEWIDRLKRVVPIQMITHLLVACELLLGAINGTVHVVKDNIQTVKSSKKRENYLRRLNELQEKCHQRYRDVKAKLP